MQAKLACDTRHICYPSNLMKRAPSGHLLRIMPRALTAGTCESFQIPFAVARKHTGTLKCASPCSVNCHERLWRYVYHNDFQILVLHSNGPFMNHCLRCRYLTNC